MKTEPGDVWVAAHALPVFVQCSGCGHAPLPKDQPDLVRGMLICLQGRKLTTWQQKLTMQELEHLRGNGMTTLAKVKSTRLDQNKGRERSGIEPCWDCRAIYWKLGLE